MIRVACPHCGRTYRTQTEGMGKTAVCTKCRQTFRIGAARPKFEWQSSDLGEDSWIGVAPPEEKKELPHCIMCDAPMAEGMVRCPECGANQVTGMVHKKRQVAADEARPLVMRVGIPAAVVLVVLGLIGGGAYWAVSALMQHGEELGDELATQGLIAQAVQTVRDGGTQSDIDRLRGRLTDANLERILSSWGKGDDEKDAAVLLLVEYGDFTRVDRIIDRPGGLEPWPDPLLAAVGARRLVELSTDEDEWVRQAAARGMIHLQRLPDDDATRQTLAVASKFLAKVLALNAMTRPYPEATGEFRLIAGEVMAPFPVTVEQIGRVFELQILGRVFTSSLTEERTFTIPIDVWCSATGTAVDAVMVRGLLDGEVVLSSPLGVSWRGTMTVTARRPPPEHLPGFVPVEELPIRTPVTLDVTLE